MLTCESRSSASPLIHSVWRAWSFAPGHRTSMACEYWNLAFLNRDNRTSVLLNGPATAPTSIRYTAGQENWGLVLKPHVFAPGVAKQGILNASILLPALGRSDFQFGGHELETPTFETAESFVAELVRRGILVADAIVDDALAGQAGLSVRAVERRMVRVTGMTRGQIRQIDRARRACGLLQAGNSVVDVVDLVGYSDQPHMTRSLRLLAGRTPARILAES
jgi:AraC-like DNA-binding protein